jgi:hypothetical protein
MFAEECQKQQPSLRSLGARWVVLWPCHSLNGENWDVYVECIVIICYEWNLDLPFCIQYFLSNGRSNMKRHTIDHRREKNNVGFKRTKQNMLCQGTLRPNMCFFVDGTSKHVWLIQTWSRKRRSQDPWFQPRLKDWLWNKPGCDVLMVGKWEGHVPKYIKIWNMFGFAWGAQEVKMIPYGFPSGFPIGTVRQMLEQIQGMGSSLHGYWMMCIPCILSGSYLSSMGVIHSWL